MPCVGRASHRTVTRSTSNSTGPGCSRKRRRLGRHQSSRCVYSTCKKPAQQALSAACDAMAPACCLLQARPVVAGGPFVVHESDAPLTVPAEPQLVTDVRAVERAEFDAHMTAKMQQQEVSKLQRVRWPQPAPLCAWVCAAYCRLKAKPLRTIEQALRSGQIRRPDGHGAAVVRCTCFLTCRRSGAARRS